MAFTLVIKRVISKILANRIKPLLDSRLSPFQASFIPGRRIHNNIIVVRELIHSMHKVRGRRGFMAIKIDLEKAYDHLNQNFIRTYLEEFSLPNQMLEVTMSCISSSSF